MSFLWLSKDTEWQSGAEMESRLPVLTVNNNNRISAMERRALKWHSRTIWLSVPSWASIWSEQNISWSCFLRSKVSHWEALWDLTWDSKMLINAQIKNLLYPRNKHSVIFCYALVVLSTKLVCGFHSLASRGDCSVAFCVINP